MDGSGWCPIGMPRAPIRCQRRHARDPASTLHLDHMAQSLIASTSTPSDSKRTRCSRSKGDLSRKPSPRRCPKKCLTLAIQDIGAWAAFSSCVFNGQSLDRICSASLDPMLGLNTRWPLCSSHDSRLPIGETFLSSFAPSAPDCPKPLPNHVEQSFAYTLLTLAPGERPRTLRAPGYVRLV